MSDELFSIPPSPVPRLAAARARLALAEREWCECPATSPDNRRLHAQLENAREECEAAEREALEGGA